MVQQFYDLRYFPHEGRLLYTQLTVSQEGNILCSREKIRLLRGEKHLTQSEAAEQVGLSARGCQDLELGAKPRYDTLLRIADFYDVSVDWLVGPTENRSVTR